MKTKYTMTTTKDNFRKDSKTVMRVRICFFLVLLLLLPAGIFAAKNSNQSTLTVTSFDRQGKVLHSGYGFFISKDGQALATFDVFKDAASAEIRDAAGKKWQVTRICGANSLYNIVKFNTDCKSAAADELSDAKLQNGEVVSAVPNSGNKKAQPVQTRIDGMNDLDGIKYYTLATKLDDSYAGCPIFDSKGRVAAMVQGNSASKDTKSYALDIAFQTLLKTTGMSAAEIALNGIKIPKQLPEDESQAFTYICLLPQNTQDSLSYLSSLQDFITAYPKNSGGYTQRASYWAACNNFDKADADYQTALGLVSNKEDIHYELSKIIYRLNMLPGYKQYKDWNMEKALSEAEAAYSANPLPLFILQKADCQFALKQYKAAFQTYQQVNATNIAGPKTFAAASVAAEMDKQDSTVVLALLDSAINRFEQPYPKGASIYLLQRASHLNRYGRYLEAANDYQAVEDLAGTNNLSHAFFYIKEQCDLKARLYPRALSDIEKALHLSPGNYDYLVEKALAEWRMGDYDEAIFAGQQALKANPKGADAYKAIGLAQGEKGNKKEALQNLQKAKELGDPQAEMLMKSLK